MTVINADGEQGSCVAKFTNLTHPQPGGTSNPAVTPG